MRNVLSQVLKLNGDLHIKDIGGKRFMFIFDEEGEKDRVMVGQQWTFNKALLFHGFLLGSMSAQLVIVLGETAGDVLEVETEGGGHVWDKYL
ncbi:hypothetical protein REPUB_Repub12eG0034600 [Reevesia pubescens]